MDPRDGVNGSLYYFSYNGPPGLSRGSIKVEVTYADQTCF